MICRGSPLMSGVTPLAYDTAGGRLASMCIPSIELTNATAMVDAAYRYTYDFDDIGNRKTSSERGTNSVYTASQLNQYTAVDDFTPTYDADGNETLVKTATGIWQVTYNGENRPVRWELVSSNSNTPNSNTPNSNTQTLLRMSFDRMGRRVTKNDQRFVYNGYLQICNYNSSTSTSHFNYYIWDPTELVATRPLAWNRGTSVAYYTHDGNKNVSEVIASDTDVAAHYEYAPFGALTVSRGESAAANPFRFSSEYAENDTATVYYNYRHYEPETGRWMQRDPIGVRGGLSLYGVHRNDFCNLFDRLGRDVWTENTTAVGGWHRRVCVDVWKRDPSGACCFDKNRYSKTGKKYCISFGAKSKDADIWDSISGDGGSSDSDSSGDSSVSGDESLGETDGEAEFPSGFDGTNSDGDGAVYEDMKNKKTEEKQRMTSGCACDIPFKRYMQSLVKKSANYALFRQSCRNFSDAMFAEAEVRCAGKE